MEILIRTYTKEDDIICDPFVGNGTIINAAEELNRNSIGIDINNYNEKKISNNKKNK